MPGSAPVPPTPPRALSCDLWYTLAYFPPADRDAHTRRRVAIWTKRLIDGGQDRPTAVAWVARLVAWGRRREAAGTTPSIPAQSAWLARATGIPPAKFDGVGDLLDASLLRTRILPAPGALSALDRLASAGVRLGILSNILFETSDGTRSVLERLELAPRFRTIYLSGEHRYSKPHPAAFRAVVRRLGVRPSEAAHVGDLPYDVDGARSAGLRPILYTGLHRFERPRPPRELGGGPTLRAARWSELPSRLLAPGARR